jgi:hypothetical protein
MDELLEFYNHYLGKHCRGILQSKWKDCILITPPLSDKNVLVSIILHNPYMMVPPESIFERIHFLESYVLQYLIHEWCWECIM